MDSLKVKTAEFFPLMLIHAQDTKHAGAARLHVLAATLDHNENCNHSMGVCNGGSGKIERSALEAAALSLGVKRSTYFSWLADATKTDEKTGFAIFSKSGDYLYLASQEKLAQIFLCNTIDKSKAIIPLKLLFKAGWKSVVWAAYLKANHHKKSGHTNKLKPVYKGKVISSKTLEDITGVSPRQQRRYSANVKRKSNIAITTTPGSWETANTLNQAAQDHGKDRHHFPFNDPQQKDPAGFKNYRRVIAHTIPMRRTVSDKTAKIGAEGRRARILAAIEKGLRLVIVCNHPNYPARPQQAMTQVTNRGTRFERIYLETADQVERLARSAWETFIPRGFSRRLARVPVGVWDRGGE